MLTCENITASREGRELFKGVSFTLGQGALLLVRGANGSGKTTLLRILAGLIPQKKGKISWNGEPIAKVFHAYTSLLCYISHKPAMKPQLTVQENLVFWADMGGVSSLLPAAMSYFLLNDLADTPLHQLSAGWQKRVALARLLVTDSDLWLLDEPFVNLDKEGKDRMLHLIRSRVEQGGTVIMATHEEKLALKGAMELELGDFTHAPNAS